jgi:hypothetical protein
LNADRALQLKSSVGHRQIPMLRKSTIQFLVIALLIVVPTISGYTKPATEQLIGTVVAYDQIQSWVPCFDKCEGSLIVRVNEGDTTKPRYIRVDLSYRNQKFPTKLLQTNVRWRFRLVRTEARDEPLYQFIIQTGNKYGPEKRWVIWRVILNGEKLPFEQMIASYSLDGFKQVR